MRSTLLSGRTVYPDLFPRRCTSGSRQEDQVQRPMTDRNREGGGVGISDGAPPGLPHSPSGDCDDLKTVPYKECMRRAEAAIARIAACDDIDEHVQLVREAERCIREAQARVEAAEGDIQRILGSATSAAG